MSSKSWNNLSFRVREALADRHTKGLPYDEFAKWLDTTPYNLKRYIQEHNHYKRNMLDGMTEEQRQLEKDAFDVIKRLESNDRITGVSRDASLPTSKLTDIYQSDNEYDKEQWKAVLQGLKETSGVITVMHASDIHFPYHDESALDLFYKVVEQASPHVIVVGSDSADFALISSFGADPDLGDYDELDNLQMYWQNHICRIKEVAPDAILIYIKGNHEHRIENWIKKNASQMRRRIIQTYENIIRNDGDVLFIGHIDAVRIGPLLVQHGNRVGQNAAKGMLQDAGYQVSIMAGHTHKITSYTFEGEDFSVHAVTGGCLQQVPEHYHQGRRRRTKAHQGTVVATVNLNGRDVWFENLKFEQSEYGHRTLFRGSLLNSVKESQV